MDGGGSGDGSSNGGGVGGVGGGIDGCRGAGSCCSTSVGAVIASTCTLRATERFAAVRLFSVANEAAPTASLCARTVALTRTLAGPTERSMSEGSTPSKMEARPARKPAASKLSMLPEMVVAKLIMC